LTLEILAIAKMRFMGMRYCYQKADGFICKLYFADETGYINLLALADYLEPSGVAADNS
jgi:hypothetical protein